MRITEPSTMLTDYLLGGATLFWAVRLFRDARAEKQMSMLLWAGALIATGVAALVAGSYHGFGETLGDGVRLALWKITVYGIGLASYFMASGTIQASVRRPVASWLQLAVVVKFMLYAAWMATHNHFRYVIYDYAPALLLVLALQAYAYFKVQAPSARWMATAVVVSVLAAVIQQSGVALHQHLNHDALYHLVQIGANYLFYRGARLLRDG